jgi:hypothetical protein
MYLLNISISSLATSLYTSNIYTVKMSEDNSENNFWFNFDNYYNFPQYHPENKVDFNIEIIVMSFSDKQKIGSINSNSLNQYLKTDESNNLRNAMTNLAPKYVDFFYEIPR